MKHNSVWGKILLLALSFIMAFSTLVSCTKDDIKALNDKDAEIQESLTTTAEDLAKLKTLVNQVKATADAAAAKTALDEALAALEEIEATAGAAATKAALDAVAAELKTALEANGASDASVKAALETTIAGVKATADAAATKADLDSTIANLNAAKTALDAADKTNKEAIEAAVAAFNAAKAELDATIAGIQATAGAAATKAELEAAVNTLDAAIKGVDDKANAAATKAEFEAAKAELDAAIAGVKATAEAAVTTEALTAAIDAAKTEIQGKIDALTTRVNELSTSLDNKYNELSAAIAGKADSEYVEQLAAQLAEIKASLDSIVAEDGVIEFVNEYKKASEMLKIDSEDNEYSLVDWAALVASVKEENYVSDVYEAFEQKEEILHFFLNRAVSRDEIKGYFAELQAYINNSETMPTFEQTLEKMVLSFECGETYLVVNDATADTMTKMGEAHVGAVNAGLNDTTLTARYNKIVLAYDNLLAAEAASVTIEGYIDAIDALIIYEDSNDAISTAVDAFSNFYVEYFQNKAEHKDYYEQGKDDAQLAATLVENYDDMVAAETRYYKIVDAWDNKVVLSELALGWATARPLYTDAESLAAELAAVNAWIEEYELETENVQKMYAVEYELITKSSAYADAMAGLYDSHAVEALNARIAALIAIEDNLLYNSLAEAEAIVDLVEALEVAIKDVENYDSAIDGNFLAMVTEYAELVTTYSRLGELVNAKDAIDDLADDIAAFWDADEAKYVVGFSNYDAIKAIKAVKDGSDALIAGIDWVCEHYNIAVSDVENSNYMLIVDATQKAYNDLFAAYEELTAELREAYDTAMGILDNPAYNALYPISYANESIRAIKIVKEAVQKYGVADADINLPGTVDGDVEVNFTTLLLKLSSVATNIAAKGAEAEAAYAADVAALITAMAELDAKILDNKAAIDAAYDAIVAWAVDYLGVAADVADADLQAAVDAVQGMNKYDGANNDKVFALLTSADCAKVITAKNTAKATYDAAKAEWDVLLVEIDRLTAMIDAETYSIHTKDAFAAAEKAYNEYRAKYYATGSALAYFNEINEKADFDTTYAAFNAFYADAEAALLAIKTEIGKLPTDLADYKDMTKANDALTVANGILDLIAQFNAKYDKDDACNAWFVTDEYDYILDANKAKNMALTMIEANTAGLTGVDYDFIHSFYVVDMISNAETVAEAEGYYSLAKTDIAAKVNP
ncbi:MAG: hypothetical protein E7612_01970 [Ruminococcaceae bacterium]|nr:hypothetical protein [Oscillospiraceae bacterium]